MLLFKFFAYLITSMMVALWFWGSPSWTGWLIFLGIPYALIVWCYFGNLLEKYGEIEKLDVPRGITLSLMRLGLWGLVGCAGALALYGAALAYPALFGHPSLHDLNANRPGAGSLDRMVVLVYFMYGGLVLRALVELAPHAWGWYWRNRADRGEHWLWGF
jgi:hypothetical protein